MTHTSFPCDVWIKFQVEPMKRGHSVSCENSIWHFHVVRLKVGSSENDVDTVITQKRWRPCDIILSSHENNENWRYVTNPMYNSLRSCVHIQWCLTCFHIWGDQKCQSAETDLFAKTWWLGRAEVECGSRWCEDTLRRAWFSRFRTRSANLFFWSRRHACGRKVYKRKIYLWLMVRQYAPSFGDKRLLCASSLLNTTHKAGFGDR